MKGFLAVLDLKGLQRKRCRGMYKQVASDVLNGQQAMVAGSCLVEFKIEVVVPFLCAFPVFGSCDVFSVPGFKVDGDVW